MKLWPLLVSVVLASPAAAQHKPMVFVAAGLIAADCGTTMIALRDTLTVETNPLLPKRPNAVQLLSACAAGLAVTWFVAEALPEKARPWVYGAVAAIELAIVIHNIREIRK